MPANTIQSQIRNRAPYHPLNGILGVIQPHIKHRGNIDGATAQMANARMALALRDDPPHAVQMALLQAYRRHRPKAH